MIKVLSAATVSDSVIFFYGMPTILRRRGYRVDIVSSPGSVLSRINEVEGAVVHGINMQREISLLADLVSLFKVTMLLLKERPSIVNSGTPKAGLLFLIAAWITRTPIRIYHVRGLRHESLCGWRRALQILIEKTCGSISTHVICETESLMRLAISQSLYSNSKCRVLGPGSSGVELAKFNLKDFSNVFRSSFRRKLGLPENALVIGFLGRLVPRKGVSELLVAWKMIRSEFPDAYLLLAGPQELAQPLSIEEVGLIESDSRIVCLGAVYDVAKYYAVMDVFTLPAHWEGFGNVLVEAAAMGVPVVTTDGTGTVDAVSDGFNGTVVPVKDVDSLYYALVEYLQDPQLRYLHGNNGIVWSKKFDRSLIINYLADFYDELLLKAD